MKHYPMIVMLCAAATAAPIEQGAFNDAATRAAAVEQLRNQALAQKSAAEVWARQHGLPVRRVENGVVCELMAIEDGRPVFNKTDNANAAISTAANLIRETAPYNVNGTNLIVGIWDGGGVRTNHQEFGQRAVIRDVPTSGIQDHATHVAGTIGAAGVVAAAKGMAPKVSIDSYDWNSDTAEMASRGASSTGQTSKIYLSNHSYGYVLGWYGQYWYGGSISAMYDARFGMYQSAARTWDALATNMPYYLICKSAGNDRSDNPAAGSTVYFSSDGFATWSACVYTNGVHPPGDGLYENGYDTMDVCACAKNILTVGAVNDAVSNGARSVASATMSPFSGWGPADDGRIKPDLVGDGVNLYSSLASSTNAYGTYSGTSMATPNICGSAALLVDYYAKAHAGSAMRASTLKALLIHTADDVGNPGPDYANGWGLANVKAAADLIGEDAGGGLTCAIVEDPVSAGVRTNLYAFAVDGTKPFKATLCWTDPAGAVQSTYDNRTPNLVHDLDLRIVHPASQVSLPFKLDVNAPAALATNLDNTVDNVEQVLVNAGATPGAYTVLVTYKGTLTWSQQYYSLVVSGAVPEPAAWCVGVGALVLIRRRLTRLLSASVTVM